MQSHVYVQEVVVYCDKSIILGQLFMFEEGRSKAAFLQIRVCDFLERK